MMNETRQHHAYQRGVRMASLWKRLKGTILKWDSFWLTKARKYKLPAWLGHMPVAVALLVSLIIMLVGGAIITGALLFIWAIAFILQQVDQTDSHENDANYFDSRTDNDALAEYRDGDQGYGLYCGSYRIDLDDD
ncbi:MULTISPECIES: DUF3742 family protein [unclassified Serratia (in: enterobacteria)]|uniref:DUF3742 family protein n=2 Tax=Serratia TaxID=613 RepID=UPI00117993B6|nr:MULTISPECIES: DUF3742 family protein [unclassified Serratia (in: enterobacteria)]